MSLRVPSISPVSLLERIENSEERIRRELKTKTATSRRYPFYIQITNGLFSTKRNSPLHRPQTWVFLATRVTSARPPVRSDRSTVRRGMTTDLHEGISARKEEKKKKSMILIVINLQSVRQGSPALQHPSRYQENPPGPYPWW